MKFPSSQRKRLIVGMFLCEICQSFVFTKIGDKSNLVAGPFEYSYVAVLWKGADDLGIE